MQEETKIWGSVRHIFDGPVSVSLLRVNAGGYSSIHRHAKRFNHFFVVSGCLKIRLYSDNGPDRVGATKILRAGESCTVRPGTLHKFETVESGQIVETYWTRDGTPAEHEDIERVSEGGIVAA